MLLTSSHCKKKNKKKSSSISADFLIDEPETESTAKLEEEREKSEEMKTKIRKQLPWQRVLNLPETRRQRPSKLRMKTASHYYHFLHHVCRPVGYTQPARRQKHSGPIPNSPTVIPPLQRSGNYHHSHRSSEAPH